MSSYGRRSCQRHCRRLLTALGEAEQIVLDCLRTAAGGASFQDDAEQAIEMSAFSCSRRQERRPYDDIEPLVFVFAAIKLMTALHMPNSSCLFYEALRPADTVFPVDPGDRLEFCPLGGVLSLGVNSHFFFSISIPISIRPAKRLLYWIYASGNQVSFCKGIVCFQLCRSPGFGLPEFPGHDR